MARRNGQINKVQCLIELLEEKRCLWKIFLNEYTKREVKEKAYL